MESQITQRTESRFGTSTRSVTSAADALGAPSVLQRMFTVYVGESLFEMFGVMVQLVIMMLAKTGGGFSMGSVLTGMMVPMALHFGRMFLVFHTESKQCRSGVILLDAILTAFHAWRLATLGGSAVLNLVNQLISAFFLVCDLALLCISFLGLMGMRRRERLPAQTISQASGIEIGVTVVSTYLLESTVGDNTHQDGSDKSCLICLEDYTVGTQVSELHCGHLFHATCVAKWIASNKSCPMRCAMKEAPCWGTSVETVEPPSEASNIAHDAAEKEPSVSTQDTWV